MKFVRILIVCTFTFFASILSSKAFKTQLDYKYQVKDFQYFKQYYGTLSNRGSDFVKLLDEFLLDKDGYLNMPSLCKFHYEKSCLCGISDKHIYSLDPLDTDNCFCFDYPRYKSGNYATIFLDLSGNMSVFVNTHGNSKIESDQVTGRYDYGDMSTYDNSEKYDVIYNKFRKYAAKKFDIDDATLKYLDNQQIKDFVDYGYCPNNIVINPGHDNDSSFSHEGDIFFGKYGEEVSSRYEQDFETLSGVILFKKYSEHSLTEEDINNALYSDFNDVFDVDSQSANAFSREDKNYIDNVIYDLNNSSTYSDDDLAFCDFSREGNNTYDNLYKALDFANYVENSYLDSNNYKTHLFLRKLLKNNDYEKLAEAVKNNLGTGSKCYEKFGTYDNGSKFETLYDKAELYLNGQKVDPNKNTIKDCKSLLGDPNTPGEVAYYLQRILNFIKILGPVLIIALSVYDYVKAIPSGDKEILSKVNKRSAIRISAGIALFFTPILIKALFTLLGLYSGDDCNIG